MARGVLQVASMRIAAVLVALAFASCQPTPATTVTVSPAPGADDQMQHRMHVRFEAARQLEMAIAFSSLDTAKREATTIAELDEPTMTAAWRIYVDDIQERARGIRRAADVATAARLVGTLGGGCANCHLALHATVAFDDDRRPPRTELGSASMADHQWAALQMWEGLIAPSEARWRAGAEALTEMPSNLVAEAVTRASPDDVDDVSRIRLDATRATTGPIADRAALFGEMLATCAHCHGLLRDR